MKQKISLFLLAVMTSVSSFCATEGALPGVFSVGPDKKIVFSKGNLQYVGTWQFAEHQWDCFGTSQFDDHRDLFGWGTGDAPNKISTDNNDYPTFTDWGVNAITNGGNKANLWRTLTKNEWSYLFYGRENAVILFSIGSVNGMNGLILLPDNWILPANASFIASTTLGLVDQGGYFYNGVGLDFSQNTYTAEQWSIMESAGAVFFPAAGDSDIHDNVGSRGYYWSSTPNTTNTAYVFGFTNSVGPRNFGNRYGWCSVRLVHDLLPSDTATVTCATEGALSGVFSVGPDKKIVFSKGNLQYQASTNTWRFAENQWDYVGNATLGTVYENNVKCNNSLISPTYDGWIDFFGWGTGNNPMNISTNNYDYGTFTDWGIHPISNGGNEANIWSTLTKDEWVYLAHERANADVLFGMGSINGINGFILLPDRWIAPDDLPLFAPGPENGLAWRPANNDYYNPSGNSFSHNTYTDDQWQKMEINGAVFLPAAGARTGTSDVNVQSRGSYWSTDEYNTMYVYDFDFYSQCFNPQECDGNSRNLGQSVRLVHEVLTGDTAAFICDGESFTWYDSIYSQAGNYQHTFASSIPCIDSIVTLHLLVGSIPSLTVRPDTTIQSGDSVLLWATGAEYYQWSPAETISDIFSATPTANPVHSTTYTVTGYNTTTKNLVKNGDFELGNNYFTTQYTFANDGNLITEGRYVIGETASAYHPYGFTSGDHTTGSGKCMIVNGSTDDNVCVWQQVMDVSQNTNYAFSAWIGIWSVTSENDVNQSARLQFYINDEPLGNIFMSPLNCGVWEKFYSIWNSGNNTTVTIKIVNKSLVAAGNDFMIDDISFEPLITTCSATDSVTITTHSDTTAIICEGETFTWYDSIYSQPGDYQRTFASVSGGNSIVTLHLLVNPLPSLTARPDTVIQAGESVLLWATGADFLRWEPEESLTKTGDGQVYAHPQATTTYTVMGYNMASSGSGNLVVNGDFEQGNIGFSTEEIYFVPYSQNGGFGRYTISDDLKGYWNDEGTPSVKAYGGTGNMMIVDGAENPNIIWEQQVSVKPDTYYAFSTQVMSCGSSHQVGQYGLLQFSVNGTQLGPIFNTPSELYEWARYYDIWYSRDNTTAILTIFNQNTNGQGNDFAIDEIRFEPLLTTCSATDSVTIIIPTNDTTYFNPIICESGLPYTHPESGIVFPVGTVSQTQKEVVLSNQYGLDSVLIVTLTINTALYGETTATICSGEELDWEGDMYSAAGDYTKTIPSKVTDCDSIVTLHLLVANPSDSIEYAVICEGETYMWHGKSYKVTSNVTETIPNAAGCDSVCTLHLTVNPSYDIQETKVVSDTLLPIEWNGQTISSAGVYYYTDTTVNGCDSIITLTLTVQEYCDTLAASVVIPDVCADDDSLYVDISYTAGTPVTYTVSFGEDAVGQGFQSSYNGAVQITSGSTAVVSVPIPKDAADKQKYPRPNMYQMDISIADACDVEFQWKAQPFTVHYPSWLMLQRWNDVLSLCNEDYNGGYVFSDIRWFHEGTPVDGSGEHGAYLYVTPNLVYGDAYWAELTRADDGVTMTTCPYYPVKMQDDIQLGDVIEPYVTVTPNVVSPQDMSVTVTTNICGTYFVYNSDGNQLGRHAFCPPSDGTFTIDLAPYHVGGGMYVIAFHGVEGSMFTTKVIVKQ